MRGLAAALLLLWGAGTGLPAGVGRPQEPAQEVAPPWNAAADKMEDGQVVFAYVPRAPEQAPWEIRLGKDQSGTYREMPVPGAGQAPGEALGHAPDHAPGQALHVSDAVWKRVHAAVPAVRRGRCETKQKGIAQTGAKTFSVVGGSETASCTFNYSDEDVLNDAASVFLALAETMQQGTKLQHDHRFAKLSLDADMDTLVEEVAAGRALEPANIGPALLSVVADDHVIDRVRRKAARLLQDAGVAVPAIPAKPR